MMKTTERSIMPIRIASLARELTPFEHLVLGLLCEGKTNSAIAHETSHTEKVVENTITRSVKAFGIQHDPDTNIRVLLALGYRAHYGDAVVDRVRLECSHFQVGEDGQWLCSHESH
jgi:DNA-binding NarL/FixJ family response regulator